MKITASAFRQPEPGIGLGGPLHNERPPLVKRVDQRRCQSCIHRLPGVLSIGQCSEESPADLPPKLRSAEHELAPELPGLTRRKLFVLEDHGDLVEELLLPRLLDLKKVLLEVVGNTQDRGVGAQLELLLIEPRAQPPVHLFRKCESTRSGVLRLEPVLVVVEATENTRRRMSVMAAERRL